MSYKFFTDSDIQSAKESLSEFIPVTGTILSGSFLTWPNETNIKKYTATHGLFESVYDYPYLSSSANHIFDITIGVRSGSSTPVANSTDKTRIYTQMAQTLLGFDVTGNVKNFTVNTSSTTIDSAIFIPFSRLLIKDEIYKGNVQIILGTSSFATPTAGSTRTLTDSGASATTVYADSPVGEYYYLTSGATTYGTVFYQAGVVVLNAATINTDNWISSSVAINGALYTGSTAQGFSSASITEVADSFRRLVTNIQFNNSTQLYSTIYNCRIDANEFNFSSNPTYVTGSLIRVKTNPTDKNYSYITTVGLYSDNDELLATAKLSEPLRNTDAVNYTLSVRLDY
jgi:hypothetical protein